jgi:osmotically-inducible protein OsmY
MPQQKDKGDDWYQRWISSIADDVASNMEGEEERESRMDALHRRLDQLSRRFRQARGRQCGRGPRRVEAALEQLGDEDTRIWDEVSACLTDDWYVDGTEITVSVDNGEVTLDGIVENRAEKRLAEDCADSVPGVVDVHNRLRIRQPDKPAGKKNEGPDILSRRTAI